MVPESSTAQVAQFRTIGKDRASSPGWNGRKNVTFPSSAVAPMPTPSIRGRIADIEIEIDQARRQGPLTQIVVPPCPELLTRLEQVMKAEEPDLAEVARIANADVAMTATLVRHANGALFAGNPPVASAGQAMNRLGLRRTADLMRAFLVRHAIPVRSPLLNGFWDHSTQRAETMAWIAGQLPGLSPDLAYSVGLFCHVGQPVLMQSLRGYAGTMVEGRARRDRSFVETENTNHRTDHAVAGALTVRCWNLAPAVVAAVRLHHSLESLGSRHIEPEVQTLLAAALVADMLVARRNGLTPEPEWEKFHPAALGWLGIALDDVDGWHDALSESVAAD